MSNKSNSTKKHFILKSTITASLLLSPAAAIMQQTQIAHAAEQTKDENLSNDNKTKDLDSGKYIDTKDILKEESKKKLVPKTNESKSLVKQEAGETSSSDTYNSPMSYNNGTYEFGQGDYKSGVKKALDLEENINDDEITSKHITPTKKDNFVHITTPGETADTIGSGSGFAISKHVIVTNNHVTNNRENSNGFTPYKNDEINIYPLRDGNNIPYKLKPTKVQMLKSADVTLLFVEEDLSKIMNITPLASEDEITNLKEKSDIKLTGYPVGRRHDNVVKYGETKTPYETNGEFLLNATSIHPVFYYKDYTESGMSGSPIINNGKLIGLHAGIIDKNNGNEGDTSYGYTFTKELRKDILKAIPELGETNTEEEPKAEEPSDKDKDGGNTAKAAEEDPKDPNVNTEEPNETPDKNKELDPNTNNPDGDPDKEDPAEKPDDPKSDNPDADNPSDKTDNPDSNDPDSDTNEEPTDNPDEPSDNVDEPDSNNPSDDKDKPSDKTDEPDSNDPDNDVKEDPTDNPDEPADKADDPDEPSDKSDEPDSNKPDDTEDPSDNNNEPSDKTDNPDSNEPDENVDKEDPAETPDKPADKADEPDTNDPDNDGNEDPDSNIDTEEPSDNKDEPSNKTDDPDSNEPNENVDKEDPADTTDKADNSDSNNDTDKEEPKESTDASNNKDNDGDDADSNNNKDSIDGDKSANSDSDKNKDSKSDSNNDDTDSDKDSVDTETSLGTLDKAEEEKDLANSTSVEPGESRSADEDETDTANDSDKNDKSDKDADKEDDDKTSEDKDEDDDSKTVAADKEDNDNDKNDKDTAEANKDQEAKEAPTPVDENNNGVNDAKEEAADQVQSPDELPTYDEPEEQDHQTFGPLPDTGSTAGNVAELAVITLALGGLALGIGQYLRKRNNDNA